MPARTQNRASRARNNRRSSSAGIVARAPIELLAAVLRGKARVHAVPRLVAAPRGATSREGTDTDVAARKHVAACLAAACGGHADFAAVVIGLRRLDVAGRLPRGVGGRRDDLGGLVHARTAVIARHQAERTRHHQKSPHLLQREHECRRAQLGVGERWVRGHV